VCLLVLANQFDSRYPLVIAANRDEDHLRPTVPADFWEKNPDVVGGRDVLHGGTWLAVRRDGRFAAVTNIRGATVRQRSRGFLVRDFVAGSQSVDEYIDAIDRHVSAYAAFHLVLGDAGGVIAHYSNAGVRREIEPGLYGLSNAPPGEEWEKVAVAKRLAADRVRKHGGLDDIAADLLEILAMHTPDAPIEDQLFVRGDRYGTRASTAIVITPEEVLFVEQNYGPGGILQGEPRKFRL
jgi:uncharacterized protein with NRDE domain